MVNRYNKAEVTSNSKVDLSSLPQDELSSVLSNNTLHELARQTGAADQRERKITYVVLFWLLVLGSGLPQAVTLRVLVTVVTTAFSVFEWFKGRSFSKKALSINLCQRPYHFFKAAFEYLLNYYLTYFGDSTYKEMLHPIEEIALQDSTTLKVANTLARVFPSLNQARSATNKASVKLHARFSVLKGVPEVINVTGEREHDNRVVLNDFESRNILMITDLGYWDFKRFIQLEKSGNFFLSRVRSDCNVPILEANQAKDEVFVGKTFQQILHQITGDTLDVNVQISATLGGERQTAVVRLVGILQTSGDWYFYLTNLILDLNKEFTPQFIRLLYKLRWQIEIFFRDIQSVLKITHWLSESENGIMMQIYAALCHYVLTKIFIVKAARVSGIPQEDFSIPESLAVVATVLERTTECFLIGENINWEQVERRIIWLLIATAVRDNRGKHPLQRLKQQFYQIE